MRIMTAIVLPVLAHRVQGACFAAEPSGWESLWCRAAQAPLPQLMALQALLLLAAFWTFSLQPQLLAGQLRAQVCCFVPPVQEGSQVRSPESPVP